MMLETLFSDRCLNFSLFSGIPDTSPYSLNSRVPWVLPGYSKSCFSFWSSSVKISPIVAGHERRPGVGAVVGKLFGESTKEESTEHGTEPGIPWRPHAIGETPGDEIVGGEIGGKETVSKNKSDGVCKDSTRDGVTRAETYTLDNWFGVLNLDSTKWLIVP